MNKEKIFDYIPKWFWNLGFLREDYLQQLDILDKANLVKVITGIRRVWKSFILKQFINRIIQKWIKKENIFYLHLEDYRLWDNPDLTLLAELFDYFLENFYSWWDFYIFLDEIQNIKSWEKFIRTVSEKYQNKAHIFITWSNSNLLSSELFTLLTWRFVSLQVYPLRNSRKRFSNYILSSKLYNQKFWHLQQRN